MMWQYQIISNSFSFYQYQIIYYFLIKGIIILILKHNQYKPIAPKWQYQQSIYINFSEYKFISILGKLKRQTSSRGI